MGVGFPSLRRGEGLCQSSGNRAEGSWLLNTVSVALFFSETIMSSSVGTWWVHSELDPRWNAEGFCVWEYAERGEPPQIDEWLGRCAATFGTPPADLTLGFGHSTISAAA